MIKKFSSPKIKIWLEPMFFTGSLPAQAGFAILNSAILLY